MVLLRFPQLSSHDLKGAPRDWLPSAPEIVDACDSAARAGEPDAFAELFGTALAPQIGAPALDINVTAISARAGLLAAEQGRALYHHELRGRIPMPQDQRPEIAVWDAGTTPVWRQGILEEPKYFSFFQDAPFAAFNPNHRRKWRPHELLHGAMRFFWHPQMTRFELYLASRINELLPVVHWYGFDEIFRPRCEEHLGARIFREFCPTCESLASPYWSQDERWREDNRPLALTWAERGLEHFEREWNACEAELGSGRVHPAPWAELDSSSDAIAYMRSHWNRMTAWTFGAWVESFLSEEVDYFSSLERYMTHLAQTTRRLLGGDLQVNLEDYHARRARRAIQDVAYRIYVALAWLDEGSDALAQVEARLSPALEQAAHHVHHVLEEPELRKYNDDVLFDLLRAFAEVGAYFPEGVTQALGALGYIWTSPQRFAKAGAVQLKAGIVDALPSTAELLGDRLPGLVANFSRSAEFREHGRLAERFADWLKHVEGLDELVAELASFEAWATRAPREDHSAELFAAMPHHVDEFAIRPGRARLNKTLLRRVFSAQLVAQITGDEQLLAAGEELELARIFMNGELRVLPLNAEASRVFEAVESARPRAEWVEEINPDILGNLLENGFVIWLPEPF